MPRAWQEHDSSTPGAWQEHGRSMAGAWQEHGRMSEFMKLAILGGPASSEIRQMSESIKLSTILGGPGSSNVRICRTVDESRGDDEVIDN